MYVSHYWQEGSATTNATATYDTQELRRTPRAAPLLLVAAAGESGRLAGKDGGDGDGSGNGGDGLEVDGIASFGANPCPGCAGIEDGIESIVSQKLINTKGLGI
jgi:hypothetical protein